MNTSSTNAIRYEGPQCIERDVKLALETLSHTIFFEPTQYPNHNVIKVEGMGGSETTIDAVAVYLVGVIAECINLNLEIRAILFDDHTARRDINLYVTDRIGDDDVSDLEKRTERDPWIWEGISHLMLHLSRLGKSSHPPEMIIAKTLPNLSVKDHGIDLIALYGTDSLGVSAGECKAYLNRPSEAVRNAAILFSKIDEETRDVEIRRAISLFRSGLSDSQKAKLTDTFWRSERAYFPMVCYDASVDVDWSVNREVIDRLKPPPNRKFLVPLSIQNARSFFDSVADSMRNYAGS